MTAASLNTAWCRSGRYTSWPPGVSFPGRRHGRTAGLLHPWRGAGSDPAGRHGMRHQGGGAIGLLMVQLAKLKGAARVILSEPVEKRRQIGLELGADFAFNPLEAPLAEQLEEVLEFPAPTWSSNAWESPSPPSRRCPSRKRRHGFAVQRSAEAEYGLPLVSGISEAS